MQSANRSLRCRGFTLVELVVALVIGSILITVVLRMVTGQTRFASVQTAREEVQQNARGALEIVGSELRAAHAPGIVKATADSVVFMLPRAWGVVCRATPLNVVFPDIPDFSLPAGGAGSGLMVRAEGSTTWTGNNPRISYTGPPQAFVPGPATCADDIVTQGGVGRSFTGAGGAAGVGDVVMVYELVKYDVAEQQGDLWLRRSLGWSGSPAAPNMQPLAGPIAPGGVQFTYLDAAQAPMAFSGGTLPNPGDVRMVRFDVSVLSRQRLDGSIRQAEEGSITVQLRNW